MLRLPLLPRDSFEHISQWLQEARANADPELVITLVGNKCDMVAERQVSYEEGHAFAQRNGLALSGDDGWSCWWLLSRVRTQAWDLTVKANKQTHK